MAFYILTQSGKSTKIDLSTAAYNYYKKIGADIKPVTRSTSKTKVYGHNGYTPYGPGQNNNPPNNRGGNEPANSNREQILSIIRGEYGDDIELLHTNVSGLGTAMQASKKHRDTSSTEIKKASDERAKFWDEFSILHEKHVDQETRITANAEAITSHGHGSNGDGKDCGWFGEKCWFPNPADYTWIKYVAIAIGIGVLLWLIRPLMKIGANLTK